MTILEEGSIFKNWNEANETVYNYAKNLGFNLYRSRKKAGNNGELRKSTFVCERSGNPPKNKTDKPSKSKQISCPWHINLSLPTQNNVERLVKVTKFVDRHNHELYLKDFTEQMYQDVEVEATTQRHADHSYYSLPNRDLYFYSLSKQDLYFKTLKEDHDTIKMFKYLVMKLKEDSGWKVYCTFKPGTTTLNKLFWMTPDQVKDWKRFKNVILNDNTNKTNRYDLMLSIFFVIDQNECIRVVAQALIDSETIENYEWVLRRTLDATESVTKKSSNEFEGEPEIIITDTERTMDAAIENVYPNAFHRHSRWHLLSNLENNVKIKLGSKYESFLNDFFTCQDSLCEEIFQQNWDLLLIKHDPEIIDYLNNTLYESKRYWAKAFITESFIRYFINYTESSAFPVEMINDVVKSTLTDLQIPISELINQINYQLEIRKKN